MLIMYISEMKVYLFIYLIFGVMLIKIILGMYFGFGVLFENGLMI